MSSKLETGDIVIGLGLLIMFICTICSYIDDGMWWMVIAIPVAIILIVALTPKSTFTNFIKE